MRRGRYKKEICMEAPPSSEAGEGDKTGLGSQAQSWGLRRELSLGISTMAWALLLLSLLSQGTGEASREGTIGTSGLILCLPFLRLTRVLTLTSRESVFAFFRVLGPVCSDSAFLSVRGPGTDGHHLLCWQQQRHWKL